MEKLAFKFPGGNRIEPVAGMPEGGNSTFQEIINFGISIAFIIVTMTTLIFLIWGGISYITSQGDKGKVEASRKRIVYSLIGLVIAFISYMVINTIGKFFGVNLFNS